MKLSRKEFLKLTVILGAGGLVMACGEDTAEGGNCTQNGAQAGTISSNHGHTATVPAADINANAPKTYSIQGTSNHNHTISLTAEQLAQLAQGQSVTVTSTTDASHAHTVTLVCA
jgi:hypothetical protein